MGVQAANGFLLLFSLLSEHEKFPSLPVAFALKATVRATGTFFV
jgi:hypothetical protein